jgi:NAD(P)-dependent dehydrogenase (short-subunit alcohol dehydrogenase family)
LTAPAERVVVTGGSGALGRALVRALLQKGARVAVPYRNERAWEEQRAALGAPESLWGASADVSQLADAQRFLDTAAERLGGLDGVAALAGGYAGSGRLESTPGSEWDEMLRVNLQTVYATCRAALPHLLKRGGSVVTVSSKLAEAGAPGAAAYAAAKAGVVSLTRSLAAENRDRGVRFNCVVPSIIDTPANRAAMPKADTAKWTSPDTIASAVLFLLSPESSAVTGATIPVDGA